MVKSKVTFNPDGTYPIYMDVLTGSMDEKAVDIRNLHNRSQGYFTFDPGFTCTASCKSKITYTDGKNGILLYRGFPIDQLALKSNYLEVCYILLNGEIPNKKQFNEFRSNISKHTMFHWQIVRLLHGFCKHSHPMSVIYGVIASMSAFYHEKLDLNIQHNREIAVYRLLSKIPIIAAMCYKYSCNQPFVYPRNDLSYASNLLYMMFAKPYENYEINPILEKAMDRILILHADHEQNASTSTVRIVGSSGADPFACVAAGIASLWGHKHGGANEACLSMLKEIGEVKRIPYFIKKAKDKNDPFRLMGFGHRIYKSYDPRAIVMRETCYEILKELNISDNLLEIAIELEQIALRDSYFKERKLYPNIDFYSGIVLRAIGIPSNMFTVIFAVARTVGWIAHWKEMYDQGFKIARPRQLYIGYKKRDFHSKINCI